MPGRDDEDEGGAATRISSRGVKKLWDDPTTEDEGQTATAIVDARPMLEALRALTAKENARPASDTERTPAIGKEAARLLVNMERTPAVGKPTAVGRQAVDVEPDAPSIELDEVALTDEERMAIAEDGLETESTAEGRDLLGPLRLCLEQGDPFGVVREAEAILEGDPDNLEAQDYLASGREALLRKFRETLGDFRNVPKLGISVEEVTSLDHRTAFIVSLIDGAMTIEEILDVCAMPPFEALRTLHELLEDGTILLQPPSSRSPRS